MRTALFDTNVVEQRYLLPLLRGEEVNDFLLLASLDEPIKPAICIKSIYEILMHTKLGTKRFPWMRSELGFPRWTLSDWQAEFPDWDCVHMFYRSEEWHDMDWDEYVERGQRAVVEDQHEELIESAKMLRQFAEWKWALLSFCSNVRNAIESRMYVYYRHDTYGVTEVELNRVLQLEEEIARNALVPSEDLEIVVTALVNNCAALITDDKKVLGYGAKTIDDNWKTAFVHSAKLRQAVEYEFGLRLFV